MTRNTPIAVGRFGAAHGVRGEVRLQSFTGDPLAIADYKPLFAANGRRFVLATARLVKDAMLVVRVEGVADRDAAAALTGTELFIDRSVLPPPDDADEFYIADLIGCHVLDTGGAMIGAVVAVPNYGGGDLVEVRPVGGGETLLLPFTKAVIPSIDLVARTIIAVPPEFVGDDAAEHDD